MQANERIEMEAQGESDRGVRPTRRSNGIGRVLGVLLRIVFVIVIGVILALGIYLGVPKIYRDWFLPIRENSARIAALEEGLKAIQENQDRRLDQFGDRMAALEGKLASQVELLSELEANLGMLVEEGATQDEQIADLAALEGQIEDLEADLQETGQDLESLHEEMEDIGVPSEQLSRQLQLIRVMELVNRGRLWLVQGNFGLAAQQIETAVESLQVLVERAEAEDLRSDLMAINEHLLSAQERLRVSPVVADNELEIAWRLLLESTAP